MGITAFFSLILSVLVFVFVFFEPKQVISSDKKVGPIIELSDFFVYKVTDKGLMNFFSGVFAFQYSERYEVYSLSFADNDKEKLQYLASDFGVYKNDIVNLLGNVTYNNSDGLSIYSSEAVFDKNASTVYVPNRFKAQQDENTLTGKSMVYFHNELRTEIEDIHIVYHLEGS